MGTRTETLRLQVIDDGSAAAKKFAEGLKKAEAQAKALTKAQEAGASGKFTSGLQRAGLAAKDIEKTTAAWEKYARSVGAAGNKADWTKAQTTQIRQWESSTVSALQNVQRAQKATIATTRSLIDGMSGAGRAMGQQVASSRRLIDGMGSPSRTARATRDSAVRELAEAHAERAQNRTDSRRLLLSGAGVYAGHKVHEGTAATLHTYRDFDKYSRQTEAFGNFSKAEMAKIIAMSIHGDARTKFNDIQYLQGAKALGGRGVKSDSVMSILPEAGYYGQAMDTNLPEAVAGLEGSLFGFQRDLSTPEKAQTAARRTADLQVNAAKAFGLTHHDLKGGYEYGALGASMTGLSEEKLLAFLGLGKKLNIEGSAQGNAWRAMTGRYLTPTRKGKEALAGVGIDYSKHQKMPERLSVDNFSNMIAQQYGVKLNKAATGKLEKTFTDQKAFGNASTFAVQVKEALQGQVGISNARDANKVTASAERFRQNNVSKVDVNGLFDELLEKIGDGNLALSNSIFGEKQGSRIMAALRDKKVWRDSVAKMENTPEGKAREVSEKMSAGFEGASARWEKAKMNFETAMGRSWDNGGEGGFLTGVVDQSAKLVLALSELDAKVIQAASGVAWLGGKVVEGAGTLGLIGAAVSLKGSAAALTGAAARLGVGGALNTAGGVGAVAAGAGGVAAGATAGAVLGGGILAAGTLAGGGLDMLTPGTNGGIGSLITGGESSLQQSLKALAAERRAQEALKGYSPLSMGSGRTMTLPGGAGPGKGFTSQYDASRGTVGDFLLGKEKKSVTLPNIGSAAPKADLSQIDEAKRKADELNAHPILPKGDAAGLAPLMTGLDGLKTKGAELGAMTIKPNVDASGMGTIIQQLQTAIGLVQTLGSGIDTAKAKAASMPTPNAGGGARTGKVSSALSGAYSDTGMG